ncbi:peptidase M23 [Streptomyces sp. bgisy100]|uniref:peptidase M23 n=1 Tax=Streptomyces sp. bgisy100 TaxID=3413783 RepID=UPI003D758E2B
MKGRNAVQLAGGLAGRAAGLKFGVVGAVIFLAMLLMLGSFAGPGDAEASDGDCAGQTDDVEVPTGPAGSKEQVENAKIIDKVAAHRKLPGRATLIALMTTLQESGMRNINYGDRDSVGLFQQRPSANWGKREDLVKPEYAANAFYGGRGQGRPRGLVDIKNWQRLPLGVAAQKVQASAYPDLYAPHEKEARRIAEKAGIDLARAGSAGGGDAGGGDAAEDEDTSSGCEDGGGEKPGKPGEPFHDGDAAWPDKVRNRRSTKDAIAWAKKEVDGHAEWQRLCLAFTARAYGWNFSGTGYAVDLYRKEMPKDMRHDGDRKPPPGALMFWDTGSRAGHVAIYIGDGMIASNDIKRPGHIDVVDATDIESVWGATYLGWSPPYYPHAG